MATQGTDNLVIVDNMPAVEKLWNGRYRLEFFCKIQNPNEGWYSDSIDNWLPEFGALQDADFAGEGWSARDGEAYPDMRLVKCEAKYIAPSETHLVTLTYETLTASWVAEKDEDIDYELNGLQRVSRTFVALPDTSYTKVVGTDTITVGGDTLTLGAFNIDKTDSMWALTETWLEPGILSVSVTNPSAGTRSVETVFLGTEGTTVGPIVERSTSNYGGLQTISVTTLQDKNGNSIVDGGSNLVDETPIFTDFTYPGVATLASSSPSVYVLRHTIILNESPAQCQVRATAYTFFTTTAVIPSSDEVYGGSDGLWSPNNWASFSVDSTIIDPDIPGVTVFPQMDSIYDTNAMRGYRSSSSSVSGTVDPYEIAPGVTVGARYFFNGQELQSLGGVDYSVTVDGGPPDPIGSKWVLNIETSVAFEDVDGATYYKKVIIVTDTIPAQVGGELPYDG